jgi:F-type H+-transporting ATPase subunit gamma
MMLVSASKFRRAKVRLEESRSYTKKITQMIKDLKYYNEEQLKNWPLIVGRAESKCHLIIVCTSNNGLCGSYNGAIIRTAVEQGNIVQGRGAKVRFLCLGNKGYDALKGIFGEEKVSSWDKEVNSKNVDYEQTDKAREYLAREFFAMSFDICSVVYGHFITAMHNIPVVQQMIPMKPVEDDERKLMSGKDSSMICEPDVQLILERLIPKYITMNLYNILLDNAASEHGARMTAMDNATRSANKMIKHLTIHYNRTRQAMITKELIEIISGVEASTH